ncbi:MAG: glucose-6-phosphate isomerase, partial [Rectinema sp.]|nr:glucose-6-phosphate isomerase [Rectinema sp.]
METWKNLDQCEAYRDLLKTPKVRLVDMITPHRIRNAWIEHAEGMRFFWAFSPIDDVLRERLQKLAHEQRLIEQYRMLLDGEIMNTGEQRMVLHHLARGRLGKPVLHHDEDMEAFYQREKKRFFVFAEKVRSGIIRAPKGKPFANVVQIGIGGSDLGPRAACIALSRWAKAHGRARLEPYFISNVDPD